MPELFGAARTSREPALETYAGGRETSGLLSRARKIRCGG
jgi:hypothetical protein